MALGGSGTTAMLLLNQRGEQIVSVATPIQRARAVQGVLLLSTRPGEIEEIRSEERRVIWTLAVMALALGNTVVVAGGSFSAQAFLRLVERFRVNTAFVVPTMVAQLSLVGEDEAFDTSSLRELRSGGAPLPLEVAQRLVRVAVVVVALRQQQTSH